jgi:Mg2+ and Co2+ transporter CorA
MTPAEVGPERNGDVIAIVTNEAGTRRLEMASAVNEAVSGGKLCWIDIVGPDPDGREALVHSLGLDPSDEAWILRFGQSSRMVLRRENLRAVTWLSDRQLGHTEIHLLQTQHLIVTVWGGNAPALDDHRQQFAERAASNPLEAAAIVLQLLLATLFKEVDDIDASLEGFLQLFETSPNSIEVSEVTKRVRRLRSGLLDIDRYGSSVRLTVAGVEALPGIDLLAAQELNDYADQVEDLGQRVERRNHWAAEIAAKYPEMIAERQAKRISQLTVVSTIFLPLSFLTGFFGMNFSWMNDRLGSLPAFLILGVLLPTISIVLTALWLRRRGLI